MIDFKIHETLGDGSFGKVYRATKKNKTGENTVVALKELYKNTDEKYLKCETDIVDQNLRHVNIVNAYDYFYDKGQNDHDKKAHLYIVMEYCELGDLSEYMVKNSDDVDLPLRLSFMTDMARGLLFLHLRNIVHRDLKPENILLTQKTGHITCKISDFGISRMKEDKLSTYIGSVAYMAPEITGNQEYSHKVDVYALGNIYFAVYNKCILTNGFGEKALIPGKYNEKGIITYLSEVLKTLSKDSFVLKFFHNSPEIGELIYCMLLPQPDERPEIRDIYENIDERKVLKITVRDLTQQLKLKEEENERLKSEVQAFQGQHIMNQGIINELREENEALKAEVQITFI